MKPSEAVADAAEEDQGLTMRTEEGLKLQLSKARVEADKANQTVGEGAVEAVGELLMVKKTSSTREGGRGTLSNLARAVPGSCRALCRPMMMEVDRVVLRPVKERDNEALPVKLCLVRRRKL